MHRKHRKSALRSQIALFLAFLLLMNTISSFAYASTYPYTGTTNDKVNMRRSPRNDSVVLERLEAGESVSVLGESGSYFEIAYNNRTGYILKQYIGSGNAAVSTSASDASYTPSTEHTVTGFPYQTTTRDNVNLRRSPSSASVVLERLEAGADITVEGENGQYLKVRFDGTSGYVLAEYVYVRDIATPTPPPSSFETNSEYSILSQGSSGGEVKALQEALMELMYLEDVADGEFGSKTEVAIKACQKMNGLSQTGIADASLQMLIFEGKTKNASNKSVKVMTLSPLPGVTMREGNTGDAVEELQDRLRSLGYYSGIITGVYDKATISAIQSFQKMNGLTADGLAGSSTRAQIFSTEALPQTVVLTPTPAPSNALTPTGITVRQGDQGEAAKAVQKRLKQLGYLKGSADGKFGSSSVTALIAFQKRHGLTQDGIAGNSTQNLLFSNQALPAAGEIAPIPTTTPLTEDNAIEIQMGTRGAVVLSLQKRLTELGYYTAKMDSEYKAADRNAVRAFQKNNGLKADGVAGYETQQLLFSVGAVPGSLISPSPTPEPTPTPNLSTLRRGDSGNEVISLQQRLIQLGYLTVTADGSFGNMTADAVTAFQQRNDLEADGVAGPTTLYKLYSASAVSAPAATPSPTPSILRQGDENEGVMALQQYLIKLGYLGDSADGLFGAKTHLAIKAFQSMNGLFADGIAGPNTLSLLASATAKPAPTIPGSTPTPKPESPTILTPPKASQVRYANWYTEIRAYARKNPNATVYDFNTGLSWKVNMFSFGNHGEAEPISVAETAIMVRAFGGKYTWTPKPVWVVFSDGRIYMASTFSNPHGVEHNTANDFSGHLCIHFPRTQAQVEAIGPYATSHQKAIDTGWEVTQNMIK